MKRVYFVFGETCVGKTTWCSTRSGFVVRTSDMARQSMSFQEMATDEHPEAPARADAAVLAGIQVAMSDGSETVHVDSFPRTLEQMRWLQERRERWYDDGVDIRLVYCFAAPDVRRVRIAERMAADPDRRCLLEKRVQQDDGAVLAVLQAALMGDVPLTVVDLTRLPTSRDFDHRMSLARMFDRHAEFSDVVIGRHEMSTDELLANASGAECNPFSPAGVWLRRFLEAARREIDEALAEIPEAWWSVDQTRLPAAREEIIDVWHFIMSAAMSAGMDAEAFGRAYYAKLAINLERQRSGKYSKRTK